MKLSSISLIAAALAAIAGSVSAAPPSPIEHIKLHALQAKISSLASRHSREASDEARGMGTEAWNKVADIHADYAQENDKNHSKQRQAMKNCTFATTGKCNYETPTEHLAEEAYGQATRTFTAISYVKKGKGSERK